MSRRPCTLVSRQSLTTNPNEPCLLDHACARRVLLRPTPDRLHRHWEVPRTRHIRDARTPCAPSLFAALASAPSSAFLSSSRTAGPRRAKERAQEGKERERGPVPRVPSRRRGAASEAVRAGRNDAQQRTTHPPRTHTHTHRSMSPRAGPRERRDRLGAQQQARHARASLALGLQPIASGPSRFGMRSRGTPEGLAGRRGRPGSRARIVGGAPERAHTSLRASARGASPSSPSPNPSVRRASLIPTSKARLPPGYHPFLCAVATGPKGILPASARAKESVLQRRHSKPRRRGEQQSWSRQAPPLSGDGGWAAVWRRRQWRGSWPLARSASCASRPCRHWLGQDLHTV